MNKAEEICEALNLDYSKILNIYNYGSVVYGTNDEYSDEDYIIVFKSSLLPSGAFKDNAISSDDRMIQGICYSRSGFIDAINNYEIGALECLFLPNDKNDNKTRERVEKLFNCSHPIFGSISKNGTPTSKQAFDMGRQFSENNKKRN